MKSPLLQYLKEVLPLLEAQEDYSNDALFEILKCICDRRKGTRTVM